MRNWEEIGFESYKEYADYANSFWSQWYVDNPGKRQWDKDVLAVYFATPKECRAAYLEATRVSALHYVDVKYGRVADWKKELLLKYAHMLSAEPLQSINRYGIEHGEGWKKIVGDLFERIDSLVKEGGSPPVAVLQVKEKFAALRFYYDGGDEKVRQAVDEAETASSNTCELCGSTENVGTTVTQYMITCCAKCHESVDYLSTREWKPKNEKPVEKTGDK